MTLLQIGQMSQASVLYCRDGHLPKPMHASYGCMDVGHICIWYVWLLQTGLVSQKPALYYRDGHAHIPHAHQLYIVIVWDMFVYPVRYLYRSAW